MLQLNRALAQRIVERLADQTGLAVCVTDRSGAVLASTEPGLLGAQPAQAARVLHTAAPDEERRGESVALGMPLCHADLVVGTLLLDHLAPQEVPRARVYRTLAELFIHQTAVIEQLPRQKWVRDKLVADLLSEHAQTGPDTLRQEAALLGIDLGLPRAVVLFETGALVERLGAAPGEPDRLPRVARALRLEQAHSALIDHARQALGLHEADELGFIDDHRMVLLALSEAGAPHALREGLLGRIRLLLDSFARDFGLQASAGVGCVAPDWRALPRSCADARFAIEIGVRLHGPGRVFQPDQLGLASLVCSNDPQLKAELAGRLLSPLAHEPDLLATLEAFLASDLSPSQTAERLHIHRHTLAYRLEKILTLTGLDPRSFAGAAQFAAALMLQKTFG